MTTSYPKNRPAVLEAHSSWHIVPRLDASAMQGPTPTLQDAKEWVMRCPTSALFVWTDETGWGIALDRGACIGCNRCVVPDMTTLTDWEADADLAVSNREALVTRVRIQGGELHDGHEE